MPTDNRLQQPKTIRRYDAEGTSRQFKFVAVPMVYPVLEGTRFSGCREQLLEFGVPPVSDHSGCISHLIPCHIAMYKL